MFESEGQIYTWRLRGLSKGSSGGHYPPYRLTDDNRQFCHLLHPTISMREYTTTSRTYHYERIMLSSFLLVDIYINISYVRTTISSIGGIMNTVRWLRTLARRMSVETRSCVLFRPYFCSHIYVLEDEGKYVFSCQVYHGRHSFVMILLI